MSNEWKELGDSIFETIKGRASKFLDDNKAAKDLIADRTQALAKLAFEYKMGANSVEKDDILHEMEIVKQTIENELSALALVGKAESISTFKEIVATAFGTVIKFLPTILAAI